jgi:hypothetical protein
MGIDEFNPFSLLPSLNGGGFGSSGGVTAACLYSGTNERAHLVISR